MFKVHKIEGDTLSVKNLVLIFLTIVFGFASVITLAQINISSDISNAWQTISKLTITESGIDTQSLIELSKTGIYINPGILQEKIPFSGMVLGIDESGNVIYTYSENLMGDNLGNHIATENLKMGISFISYSGVYNKGIWFDTENNLNATQKIKTQQTVQIGDAGQANCGPNNGGEIRFISNCFQGCDGTSRKNIAGSGCNGTINSACLGTLPTYATSTSIGTIFTNTYRNYATTPGACTYICNSNYVYDPITTDCLSTTVERSCEGLPTHASWNTSNSIAQTRNGTSYIPSSIGTYNTTPSTTECRFTCDVGYTWENNACVPQITTTQCAGTLPANAISTSLENNGTRHFAMNPGNCTYMCALGYILNYDNTCSPYSATESVMNLRDMDTWNDILYFGGNFEKRFQITNHIDMPVAGVNFYVSSFSTDTATHIKSNIIRSNSSYGLLKQVMSDHKGNVYVYGFYYGNRAMFDSILTTGYTNAFGYGTPTLPKPFIAKLDSGFNRERAKIINTNRVTFSKPMTYFDHTNHMTVDSDGYIYAIFDFQINDFSNTGGFLIWNNTSTGLNSTGYTSVITKVSPEGSVIWFKKIRNPTKYAASIYNDGLDHIYVNFEGDTNELQIFDKTSGTPGNTYYFSGTRSFMSKNGLVYSIEYLPRNNSQEIYIYNNDFSLAGQMTSTGSIKYKDVTFDTQDTFIAGGDFTGAMSINNSALNNFPNYTNNFVFYKNKYLYGLGRDKNLSFSAVVADNQNNVYLGGTTFGPAGLNGVFLQGGSAMGGRRGNTQSKFYIKKLPYTLQ